MKSILIYIIINLLLFSCRSTRPILPDMKSKLLCVEDLDGTGGIANFDFGDIVVYSQTGERYILTNDDFYDAKPTYDSLKNVVYFESKRSSQLYSAGLGSPSYIYLFDLKTKQIKPVEQTVGFTDPFYNLSQSKVGSLILSHNKIRNIKTKNSNRSKEWDMVIFNFNTNKLDTLLTGFNLSFAQILTDSCLLFDDTLNDNLLSDRYIGIYHIIEKTKKPILIETGFTFQLYDYLNNEIFYSKVDTKFQENETFYIFDLMSRKSKKIDILDYKKTGFKRIRSAVFGENSSEIFFIGTIYEDSIFVNDNIYRLNLEKNELDQVTFTQNQKHFLHFCRN